MMANCIIAFPNRFDEAALSSGSWTAALPLANLQNRILAKLARSTDAANASTKFDTALTKSRAVKVVAVINHNLSAAALFRIRGADVSNFSVLLYDSGWIAAWPALYATLSLEWEDDNWWDGKMLDEDKTGYTWSLIHILPAATIARYWRIEFDDTTNAAGYVQAGRVFTAGQWQPVVNMSYGLSLGWETDTKTDKALGGAEYFDPRKAWRVARFNLDWMSIDEALGRAFEIDRRAGIDQEVLYIFDPADTVHMIRRAFIGRLRQLSPIEYPYLNTMRKAYEIKELI